MSVHSEAALRGGASPTLAHGDLFDALLAVDGQALYQLVADGCEIIGPKGFRISKNDWIHTHIDDVYELLSLEILQSSPHLWGDSAVIVDLQRSACVFNGEQIDGLFRVLSVWHSHADGWQLIALQYTAASPEAARTEQ